MLIRREDIETFKFLWLYFYVKLVWLESGALKNTSGEIGKHRQKNHCISFWYMIWLCVVVSRRSNFHPYFEMCWVPFSWDSWMQEAGVPGVSGKEFISFPRLPNPIQDHLSLKWNFSLVRHLEAELSGCVRAFSGCQEWESVWLRKMDIHVRQKGPRK